MTNRGEDGGGGGGFGCVWGKTAMTWRSGGGSSKLVEGKRLRHRGISCDAEGAVRV